MSGPADGYRDTPLRPYVITGGRARAELNLALETLLSAADPPQPLPVTASAEMRDLLQMCQQRISLVEAAAHLKLPVNIVRVLASDLIRSGHLTWRSSPRAEGPSIELLKEVLDGLRKYKV
ncbi:DUF742 domain-containing protein [Streptomyces sp. MP131-18]|uniref:DUF742 domain-containing protein n=1 Tax=Streptomyces sp. MP131-18 TaxID=1857892 RepID=UPI00097C13F5|nr:DUF742 domain-containing protein [Streptomyces sp. MP131-18]ONK13213.1 hypothetical protein STBA_39760 [Streptomyces sp. MP131-18]